MLQLAPSSATRVEPFGVNCHWLEIEFRDQTGLTVAFGKPMPASVHQHAAARSSELRIAPQGRHPGQTRVLTVEPNSGPLFVDAEP